MEFVIKNDSLAVQDRLKKRYRLDFRLNHETNIMLNAICKRDGVNKTKKINDLIKGDFYSNPKSYDYVNTNIERV